MQPGKCLAHRASADVSVDTDMVTLAILTVLLMQLSAALWTLAALLACLCRQSESPMLLSVAWEERRIGAGAGSRVEA